MKRRRGVEGVPFFKFSNSPIRSLEGRSVRFAWRVGDVEKWGGRPFLPVSISPNFPLPHLQRICSLGQPRAHVSKDLALRIANLQHLQGSEALDGWKDGGMERWRHGGMESWRDGEMERWGGGRTSLFYKFSNSSAGHAGVPLGAP